MCRYSSRLTFAEDKAHTKYASESREDFELYLLAVAGNCKSMTSFGKNFVFNRTKSNIEYIVLQNLVLQKAKH